jgi:hypothetical protein
MALRFRRLRLVKARKEGHDQPPMSPNHGLTRDLTLLPQLLQVTLGGADAHVELLCNDRHSKIAQPRAGTYAFESPPPRGRVESGGAPPVGL